MTDTTTAQPPATDPAEPVDAPARRLRLQHVIVQPILVWDDGTELHDGPQVQATSLPLSRIPDWAAAVPAEIARLAEQAANPHGDAHS